MSLKMRKKAMMLMLALSLATTSCGKDESYKENAYAKIQEIMDNSEFYQTEIFDETYEDRYAEFYQKYLDHYISYMSEEQYNTFVNMVKNMDENEHYDYANTYSRLNIIFDSWATEEGRGLYKAFNSRILYENVYLTHLGKESMAKHINTLRFLVHNDEEFFTSLYSNKIDKVIDCIAKNTGCQDRKIVEELIYKMDLFYDIFDSEDYMDEQLRVSYENRVTELIGILIESKSLSDEEFNNTLYAHILKESRYCGKDSYVAVPYLLDNTFYLQIKDGDYYYSMYDVNSDYLYQDISIEELKRLQVNDLISRARNITEEEYYSVENMMQLIVCLLGFNSLDLSDNIESEEIRHEIYEKLCGYFTSEDDFNNYILSLYNGNKKALEKYFAMYMTHLREDDITYEDYISYNCLVNYNNERKYTYITYEGSYEDQKDNYVSQEELKLMKESEYKDIAFAMEDNFFLYNIPYYSYFETIDEILARNDLGFDRLSNPDCQFTWENGQMEVTNLENTNVLSVSVKPQTMEYSGMNIIYYVFPENYEDAQPVELFPNIENTLITRKVKGFKTTIVDPESGEEKLIYVAGMDDELANFGEIRFMIDYQTLSKKINGETINLSIGGNHE